MVVQGRQKHRSNWYTMFTTVRIVLWGGQWPTPVHPFCDHGDMCTFLLPPLSDPWATDLFGDLFVAVLNMLKTSRRPWRPWHGLNVLCATLERPRQPPASFSGYKGKYKMWLDNPVNYLLFIKSTEPTSLMLRFQSNWMGIACLVWYLLYNN